MSVEVRVRKAGDPCRFLARGLHGVDHCEYHSLDPEADGLPAILGLDRRVTVGTCESCPIGALPARRP